MACQGPTHGAPFRSHRPHRESLRTSPRQGQPLCHQGKCQDGWTGPPRLVRRPQKAHSGFGGRIFLQPHAWAPSGRAEAGPGERCGPGPGAFTTQKPRSGARGTGGDGLHTALRWASGRRRAVTTQTDPGFRGGPRAETQLRPPGRVHSHGSGKHRCAGESDV